METPELDKQMKAREEGHSQALGEFIDWLEQEGIHLAKYVDVEGYSNPQLWDIHETTEQLLARYFDIDLNKIEKERRAILEELRANH